MSMADATVSFRGFYNVNYPNSCTAIGGRQGFQGC